MTESADGAKPEVRGGVPLPKVTSDAASELFSPDPVESSDAVALPPDGDPHASTMVGPVASRTVPETPRHARRSRPKAGFIAAAVAALVATPVVVLATLGGGDDRHGSTAQNRPSGAANPGVPAPGGSSVVPSPPATPTPGGTSGTQTATPDKPAKQSDTGSSGGGNTTGDGTAGGGTSSGGTSSGGNAGGGTSGGATSAPAGPPAGGWAGGAGRPGGLGGGRRGGGPRGPGMGGGFR
jgi:hypothetical protein